MIVDNQSEPQLEEVLAGTKEQLLLIFPDRDDVNDLRRRWSRHIVLGRVDLEPPDAWTVEKCSVGAIAYLLFTSGSTGMPKGVQVSQANVRHYVNWTVKRYQITEEDRLSQTFDMTFDLSAHDMFVAWEKGACVCCPDQKQLINPGNFINTSRLTVWFSVPSIAVFMKRLGMLKAGKYPNLRLSLFCGEALPAEVVKAWAEAAPTSVIENIYGPTELTIACTAYRWDSGRSPAECEFGIVPIGEPFDGMEPLVVNESLQEVNTGADGELLMTGPQLTPGYWRDPEKTARAFIVPPGKDRIYYRTGDRVRRPLPGKPLVYLGRVDNQIKVLGHRVELGEVEALTRQVSGLDGIVAVGWPVTASGAGGVEVFIEGEKMSTSPLQTKLEERLPSYMVPRRFHFLTRIPLNSNGKYDRGVLVKLLAEGL
jgi:amino acid adenylation domain-containing protein